VGEPLDLNVEERVYRCKSGVIVFVDITLIMFNWANTKAALQDLHEVLVCKKW
jgi:hypothetical protein